MSSTPTLTGAAAALRAGTTTSRALTEAAIATADRLDGRLGTFLARFDEQALTAADRADAELAAGLDRGPLHGIPFGVKDVFATEEGPTTAQSLVLDPAWGDGGDAPVVARLRAAGAVVTGKTTTMEFACGMPDASTPFPVPRNPWDPQTWAGGSSSGNGSGLATGMFLAAIGTDTAGSLRIPAAFCGVTGLMPTFGRVPKSGCVPLGYSLDHVGSMARSAADCAAVLEVVAGPHAADPDCVDAPFTAPQPGGDLSGLRIGVVREGHFPAGADPALAGAFAAAVAQLEALGASTIEVELPLRTELVLANVVTISCEALAHHRGDLVARWGDFYASTRALLAQGALVSGADYVQAQRMRRAGQLALGRLFATVDVVVCPAISVGAPALRGYLDGTANIVELLVTHMHTGYWDTVGNPVLALPMGRTAAGLPLSLQIAGRPFDEGTVLRTGAAFQEVTAHHLRVPPLVTEADPVAAAP
jgi:aspartyl-tRNA(Asn)/glutamyl-tRNA(Gln) amidotransferase subunit A